MPLGTNLKICDCSGDKADTWLGPGKRAGPKEAVKDPCPCRYSVAERSPLEKGLGDKGNHVSWPTPEALNSRPRVARGGPRGGRSGGPRSSLGHPRGLGLRQAQPSAQANVGLLLLPGDRR